MEIEFRSEITVTPIQSVGGDHMVVAAAKVSVDGPDALKFADPLMADANKGIINYLMSHRHGTPFEHASLTFFVEAPAAVWWEWVRHRIGHSFNLESGRYRKLRPIFWIPRSDRPMIPVAGSRPARPRFAMAGGDVFGIVSESIKVASAAAWSSYEIMIGAGVANEVARTVLGFGIYYCGWVTINPRSLMAFLSLRRGDVSATFPSCPALEIQEVAIMVEQVFSSGWPITHECFLKNGRVSP